jgi:hypothetical protein
VPQQTRKVSGPIQNVISMSATLLESHFCKLTYADSAIVFGETGV